MKDERYFKRKEILESFGAVHYPQDDGFVFGQCFIDDSDIEDEDEDGFEESVDLVRMEMWRLNQSKKKYDQ